jgi:restriction endonuclease Mrr
MVNENKIPKFHELMFPTLKALKTAGGSATLSEINTAVIKDMKIPEDAQNIMLASGTMPVLQNRLDLALRPL